MSKARIRRITNEDTQILQFISHYREQDNYFTLIDKEGRIKTNNDGHGIIYRTSLPEKEMATIEAYAYLAYWAEAECAFKSFSPMELLAEDFTKGEIQIPNDTRFEIENYDREVDEAMNAKPLRKLRKSILNLYEALSEVDKRIDKFSEYLEEIDESRGNPDMKMADEEIENPEDLEEDSPNFEEDEPETLDAEYLLDTEY